MNLMARVASSLGNREMPSQRASIEFDTHNSAEAVRMVRKAGFSDAGSGYYRPTAQAGHGVAPGLWRLEASGDGKFQIVRVQAEQTFIDASDSPRIAHRTASRQAQGLGANDPILDVTIPPKDDGEKEALGVSITPTAAYRQRAAQVFATWGAHCVDEVSRSASFVAKAAKDKLLGDAKNPNPVARWASIEAFAGKDHTAFAKTHALVGAQARLLSVTHGLPFRFAYRLYPHVAGWNGNDVGMLAKALKGDRTAQRYVSEKAPVIAKEAIRLLQSHQAGRLAFGPLPDPEFILNFKTASKKDCSKCGAAYSVGATGGKCSSCGEMDKKGQYGDSDYADPYDNTPGLALSPGGGEPGEPDMSPQDCPKCKGSKTLTPKYPGDEFDCSSCGEHLWKNPDDLEGPFYDKDENPIQAQAKSAGKSRRAQNVFGRDPYTEDDQWDSMLPEEQEKAKKDPNSPFYDPEAFTDEEWEEHWASLVKSAQDSYRPNEDLDTDTFVDGDGTKMYFRCKSCGGRHESRQEEGTCADCQSEDIIWEDMDSKKANLRSACLARIPRRAVDESAKRYWQTYFGDYGTTWVGDVKRRLKADMLKVALVKLAVDSSAADYYADYFGDYGKDLVEEKARSLKDTKKDDKKEASKAAACPPDCPPKEEKKEPADPFAGKDILLDEKVGSKRLALARVGGAFEVIASGGTVTRHASLNAANAAFAEGVMKLLL